MASLSHQSLTLTESGLVDEEIASPALDWLLRHHPTPRAFMEVGSRVHDMSRDGAGIANEQIKVQRLISDSSVHACSLLATLNTSTLHGIAVPHSSSGRGSRVITNVGVSCRSPAGIVRIRKKDGSVIAGSSAARAEKSVGECRVMEVTRVEQRSYVKIAVIRGKNVMEHHTKLVEALGNNALPYRTVARFIASIKGLSLPRRMSALVRHDTYGQITLSDSMGV
ncbi:hypothetical protein TNCV_588431 [Trichonephila clavipes]|nr:hypothetical protein TNCV_588431 [Trichonephila clavipes]